MPRTINRRRFLQRSAGLATLVAGGPASLASQLDNLHAAQTKEQRVETQIPIVDPHQHLWDLTKFKLPWHTGNTPLAKSFVTADYLAATQGLNVVKTVYMEVDVEPSQQVQEAEYVLDLCGRKDNPMCGAVISGRPGSESFKTYIERFKGNPFIKGVRQVLHGDGTPAGYCLGSQFVKSVQLLGELGMSFDLCLRSGELLDGDKLVAQCPKTRFILDHCGNMSVQETDAAKRKIWMDGMKALAQRENVICKVSGIVASAKEDWKPADLEPNIRFTLDTFGPDRVMFAGDWPVCTLRATFRQWVDALKWIVKSDPPANQRKLFHDNAVKFYGLKDK